MSYTIANAREDLEGILHGTDLSKIQNLYYLMARAARNVLLKVDPPETIKITQITNALHDEIYDYTAPSDLKGNKVIDIRPQVNREAGDSFAQRFSKQFDLFKSSDTFQIRHNSGTKSLRIAKSLTAAIVVNECESLTANGTWSAGGDASNLTLDELNYFSGSGALNFDVAASGSVGYVENSDMSQVDLSDDDEVGALWVRTYIPDTSIITNYILRWGNDSSNYWHRTVTYPHDQTSFKTGWNELKFAWNGATEIGTVDPEAIDYLRVSVTYDGTAETDLRIDRISCSTGEIYEIEYYSDCIFRNSAGTWLTRPTAETDILNLGEDGINLWLYECALAMAQQVQGRDSVFDATYFGGVSLQELYRRYKASNPSQALKQVEHYYSVNLYG